jgi:hypothetical protein
MTAPSGNDGETRHPSSNTKLSPRARRAILIMFAIAVVLVPISYLIGKST